MNKRLKTVNCGQGPIYAFAMIEPNKQPPAYEGGETRDDETASEQTGDNQYPSREEQNIPEKHRPDPEIDQQPEPREKEIDLDDEAGPGQAGIEGEESDTDTDLIDTPRPDNDDLKSGRNT